MDLHALWQSAAEIISEIPRSGLLVATMGAVLGSIIGTAIARRYGAFGRAMASVSTMALAAILVVIMLQISRFDPRIDIAVPELGLPEQTVAGGETRVPMAPDGHFWIRATVNGVTAPVLVDSGATLTAVSVPFAEQ